MRSVHARVLLPDVYLKVPAGKYVLLLGAPDQGAPRYDLERVRDVVLAVKAAPVETGALIAAVLVLGGLTLRLARREPKAAG